MKGKARLRRIERSHEIAHALFAFAQTFDDAQAGLVRQRMKPPRGLLEMLRFGNRHGNNISMNVDVIKALSTDVKYVRSLCASNNRPVLLVDASSTTTVHHALDDQQLGIGKACGLFDGAR